MLLSAFSLSYGFAQLPSGILLDRLGPRIVLGAGLIFWSAMQALTGMVNSFSHFILLRIGLGIGEAPFMPAGVKSINDWYAQRERGTAVGIFNSSTVLGRGYRPAGPRSSCSWPRGWRTMFVVIGLAGIVVGLCWYVGYRNRRQFTLQEEEQQYLASEEAARPALKFSEWLALFKRRTTRGMILGFSGVNYTGWLYIALVTRLFAGAAGVKPRPVPAGWRRSRFLPRRWGCGSTASVVDAPARRGYDQAKTRKTAIVIGLVLSALGTLLVVQSSTPARGRWLLSPWRCFAFILPGRPPSGGWCR
ncbi:MFS transporter [Klebsiella pneumoniae]|uniref:MFS transporter n=1 Tax=Klebsiella pneumoniae TaxID=573 RepID=A0A927DCV5_KLEPN|nr:MFS transporter [Klebsiella pneumoniae]